MFLGLIIGDLLWTIVIGLAVGIIAKAIMPGRDGGGFIMTVLLGIAGGLVGGFLGGFLPGWEGSFMRFVLAVVGAIVVLWVYRMITGRRTA